MPSVGQKLVRSAGWAVAGDVSMALSSALGTVVAARLVTKAEIGSVALVTLLLALIETLTTSGIEQALVQRARHADDLLDSAFTWQLARGALIGAALFVAAPALAAFYHLPELTSLARALALQPVLRGMTNIALVLRVRDLDFRVQFMVNATPALIRLIVTSALCWYWRDAWALIAGGLIEHGSRAVLSYVLHPRRPRLRFNRREVRSLLGFGRWVTAMSILSYLNTRGDDLFVSKSFGAADLAAYQLAYVVANVPATGISHVLGRVMFPAYARLHAEGGDLRSAYLEVLRVTTFWGFVTAGILFVALPFLPVVVGEQWTNAVPIARVLACGGALRALLATAGPLFGGTGRPDLDVRMNVPRLVVLALSIAPLAHWFGLSGVSWASVASIVACLPLWTFGLKRQIDLRLRDAFPILAQTASAALLAVLVLGGLGQFVPRSLVGLLALAALGPLLTYGTLRVGERLSGRRLLPSLQRIQEL